MSNIYKNLGFSRDPFSTRSSEEEIDYIDSIFYKPNYYDTLIAGLRFGNTRFIMGQRGHGKTSTINKLFTDLYNNPNIIALKIDRFETIPLKGNKDFFLFLINRLLINEIVFYLIKNKRYISNYSNDEKEELAILISIFYRPLAPLAFKTAVEKVKNRQVRNCFVKLYNNIAHQLINRSIGALVEVSSEFICKSLGISIADNSFTYKEYLPKLKICEEEKRYLSESEFNTQQLKDLLYNTTRLINKIGIKIVILFDKLDENQKLNNEISKISLFINDLLADTEFLMNDTLAIGFSLWSDLKGALSGKVRFDKFGTIDVRWKREDLTPLINLRLAYYSYDKNNKVTFEKLIESSFDRDVILELANRSPRDLIIILSEIIKEQANRKPNSNTIDNDAISKGLRTFCREYDYSSNISSKAGKNQSIIDMINKLLYLKKISFSENDLSSEFGQPLKQSANEIKNMVNYRLIKEESILGPNSTIYYEIIDPKIIYLIKNMIERID